MVQPDQLLLISFFKEAEPGALALQPVIAARQSHNGADAREGIAHDGHRCPITQALDVRHLFIPPTVIPRDLDLARNRDGIEQHPHLLRPP